MATQNHDGTAAQWQIDRVLNPNNDDVTVREQGK
jgi:hypothetical protein